MSDRTRLAAPGTTAQLNALVRDPDFEPGSAWVENGDEAAFIVANCRAVYDEDPPAMEARLPDGRLVEVAAAAAAIRFERSGRAWRPVFLQGVRVRWIAVGGEVLYEADDMREETVHFLAGW